jgi:hypothetical protein
MTEPLDLKLSDRLIRLVKEMGYVQTKTRDLHYKKFSAPGKLHIWIGGNGAILTGKTIKQSVSLKNSLHRLFKRYSI